MPDLTEEQIRRRRRNAATHLAAGGAMVGGAAIAQDKLARSTGVKPGLNEAKKIVRSHRIYSRSGQQGVWGKQLARRQGKYAAGWLATRGVAAAGVPLAAMGAKNMLASKPKHTGRLDIKEDVLHSAFDRTTTPAVRNIGQQRKTSRKAKAAEFATVSGGSMAGGALGSALGRRVKGRGRLLALGAGTAAGAAGGAIGASPLARRAVRHSTGGEYTYSTERGVFRTGGVRKSQPGAIRELPQTEQKQLIQRKKKQSKYSLASAGLGLSAFGLKSPSLVAAAAKRSRRLSAVKPVQRFASHAPKADTAATNLGIASLGVGGMGSLNFARIQRAETKADQRATGIKKQHLSGHRDRSVDVAKALVSKRVLVTGSRDWDDEPEVHRQLDRLASEHPDIEVIEGGARGADTHARNWAKKRGRKVSTYQADWKSHGRAAGPKRNQRMLEEGKPQRVLAFSRDLKNSKGTRDMVRRAERAGVRVDRYGEELAKALFPRPRLFRPRPARFGGVKAGGIRRVQTALGVKQIPYRGSLG